ncbi:MAG TPA: glycoside hydrolase family 43 protein [Acidobacteriaceae bacterium]
MSRVLIASTLLATLSLAGYGQAPSPWVRFTAFHYEGTDRVANEHPLSRGEYLNPILAGMYPDPSITRAGGDFYLVNSTFAWYPGVPIFHSRDLTHWQQVGSVLDRPSQLNLSGLQTSQGVFAPTIRFHDGVFYMINTVVGGIGNFYVTAKDPSGPWSDPILLPEINGIDPSFFFDDNGRAYIVHNGPPPDNQSLYEGHRAIWLFPFDTVTGRVSGKGTILVNGGVDISKKPAWIEGPHLFKRNGFYYLIAAEGGTSVSHSEVVFRSRAVDGPYVPYEGNPILTQRDLALDRTNPVADAGHADLVEAPNGTWWAVFLGVRPYRDNQFNTGRETFLLPVTWKDDWPVILPPGESIPRVLKGSGLPVSPESAGLHGSFVWEDHFTEPTLRPEWATLRTPVASCWKLAQHPGALLLQAHTDDLTSHGSPCFIARRQQHADFSASIVLHLQAGSGRSEAGLTAFQNEHSFYFFGVSNAPGKQPAIFVEVSSGGDKALPTVLQRRTLARTTGSVELRITGQGDTISFFYRTGSGAWLPLVTNADATILSTARAGGFVGTMIGPFARR